MEPDRVILMFIWKMKEVTIAKKVWKRQRGKFDLSDVAIYYPAIVAKTRGWKMKFANSS